MRESMLTQAMHALEPELVCPACEAENSDEFRTNPIHVDHRGEASCDRCGHGANWKLFTRKVKQ